MSTPHATLALALMLTVMIAGCSGPEVSPAAPPAQAQAETPQTDQSLLGTTWNFEGTVVTFTGADTVFVKGGIVQESSPDGLAGTYTVKNGIVEIAAGGVTKAGTWDGTTLVIDGITGIRQ